MQRQLAVIAAAVIAVAAYGTAAAAAGSSTDPCLSAGGELPANVITYSAAHGFRGYFTWNSGTLRKRAVPAAARIGAAKLCGSSQVVAAASLVRTDQARFYALYAAFPVRPTAGQWQDRFRPLVLEAAKADADALALISAIAVDQVAAQRTSLHCGLPPNGPNICDNETLPDTVAGLLTNDKARIAAITADRAWLINEARLPWPSR